MRKKKEREEEGIQGERKEKKKKKSYAGFKPVRLVLLVSCLCNGRGWLEGLVSLFSLPGSHSLLLFSLQTLLSLQLTSTGGSAFVLES